MKKKLKESEMARKHIQLIIKRHCERNEVERGNPTVIAPVGIAIIQSAFLKIQ